MLMIEWYVCGIYVLSTFSSIFANIASNDEFHRADLIWTNSQFFIETTESLTLLKEKI